MILPVVPPFAAAPPGVGVLHSAAGFWAHLMGDRPLVFVDAILPSAGQSWLEAAPAPLAAHIGQLASDGLLPPWPTWFGASTMARLVPDEAVREAFVADCPSISMNVLETPTPALLFGGRHAYLRLSEAYALEETEARDRGWIVRHEPLHHLAMLTHPDRLADVIIEMAEELYAS